MSANDLILNRVIQHSAQVEQFAAHEVRAILRLLSREVMPDIEAQLIKRLIRTERLGFDRGPVTTARLNKVLAETKAMLTAGYDKATGKLKADLSDFAMTEAEYAKRLISDPYKGLGVSFSMPHPNVLRSIVVSRPFEGKILDEWGRDLSRSAFSKVQRAVRIGVAEGESIPKIARRFRDAARLSKHEAEAVARTAVNHVTNHAAESVYAANDDVVKSVQMVATLDVRTTVICMDYDGQTFPLGEGPRPPFHMRCRTRVSPVLKSWKELGIDLKEIPTGVRASMDGMVPDTVKYPEWLKGQSAAVQNKALGKTRGVLFRQGKLDTKDLVGQNNRPLPLSEIYDNTGLSKAEVDRIVKASRPA